MFSKSSINTVDNMDNWLPTTVSQMSNERQSRESPRERQFTFATCCSKCAPRLTRRPISISATTTTKSRSMFLKSSVLAAFTLVVISTLTGLEAQGASRNMHQISKQTNQYFLNEFCDLQSKTLRNAKKFKTNQETYSIFLTSKNSLSSVRVLPQKSTRPGPASSMSFGFGSSEQQELQTNGSSANRTLTPPHVPILKQLNCSIIVVAPRSYGLLVTVNSVGLPQNHAKLGITLNHDSQHAQSISLDGDITSGKYLLTQSANSKIAINLQSFQPIDWSNVSFDILFTVYRSKENSTGCPNKSWFDCGENICVPSSLVCDNNRNCPNGNDEMIFYRCYSPLFWSIMASTMLAIVIAILIAIVIMVFRRKIHKEKLASQHFSNGLLKAGSGDMDNISKLDCCLHNNLHYQPQQHNLINNPNNGYLSDNLVVGGFENPVWLHTNTLTKQQSTSYQQQQQQQHQQQQQQQQQTSKSTTRHVVV